jgi:hypothetical protein
MSSVSTYGGALTREDSPPPGARGVDPRGAHGRAARVHKGVFVPASEQPPS